jgi:hypothetical protein
MSYGEYSPEAVDLDAPSTRDGHAVALDDDAIDDRTIVDEDRVPDDGDAPPAGLDAPHVELVLTVQPELVEVASALDLDLPEVVVLSPENQVPVVDLLAQAHPSDPVTAQAQPAVVDRERVHLTRVVGGDVRVAAGPDLSRVVTVDGHVAVALEVAGVVTVDGHVAVALEVAGVVSSDGGAARAGEVARVVGSDGGAARAGEVTRVVGSDEHVALDVEVSRVVSVSLEHGRAFLRCLTGLFSCYLVRFKLNYNQLFC